MLYRIYTEDVCEATTQKIIRATSAHFDGFTVLKGLGYWRGAQENSLIIEIAGDQSDHAEILLLAQEIKLIGKQQSVLVVKLNGTSRLV